MELKTFNWYIRNWINWKWNYLFAFCPIRILFKFYGEFFFKFLRILTKFVKFCQILSNFCWIFVEFFVEYLSNFFWIFFSFGEFFRIWSNCVKFWRILVNFIRPPLILIISIWSKYTLVMPEITSESIQIFNNLPKRIK